MDLSEYELWTNGVEVECSAFEKQEVAPPRLANAGPPASN